MNPTRLFDCIAYQLAHFPKEDMLAAKDENGNWRKYSTEEVRQIVHQLAGGLVHAGIGAGDGTIEGRDKVAVISANRPEWLFLDLAVQMVGAVLVPLYPTLAQPELEFVLNDASVKLVFAGDAKLFDKVREVRSKTPSVHAVYCFDEYSAALHWKELLVHSEERYQAAAHAAAEKVQKHDLATIIYTSGTTGTPKGVMLSHNNIISNLKSSEPIFQSFCDASDRALSFLPLNHIFERMISYIYMYNGVSIYYAQSMDTIGENLKEVKPTVFSTVPRLLEKVYDKIIGKGQELTGLKRKLFFWAVDIGGKYDPQKNQGALYYLQLAIANKLIFKKWREALGGNIKAIVTGAAACQVRLLKIFTAGKISILEGYGLTETSPVISVNRYDMNERRFGTVGLVIDGVELKIEQDGEICCRGENVMMGYYKRPDLTAEVIDAEGFFHTGDIGIVEDQKFLKITDRKKEIFKTSGGKYVAPQPIENKMKESKFIEQMMVVGADQKFTAALIVPAYESLIIWAKSNQVEHDSNEALIRQPKVLEMYKQIIESYNQSFNPVEQVKKFELLPNEWTVDGGELTPTLKLRRKIIAEKYNQQIARIYSSL
jgi:long-chain acyl-CoA synthetase